jgi:hypothetical protein
MDKVAATDLPINDLAGEIRRRDQLTNDHLRELRRIGRWG